MDLIIGTSSTSMLFEHLLLHKTYWLGTNRDDMWSLFGVVCFWIDRDTLLLFKAGVVSSVLEEPKACCKYEAAAHSETGSLTCCVLHIDGFFFRQKKKNHHPPDPNTRVRQKYYLK